MLRAESLRRHLGQLSGLALALDLRTSHGRPTITYKNKYNFLPVLLMATKVAKVNKLSQVKETVPVDADRFPLAHPGPAEEPQGHVPPYSAAFAPVEVARLQGDALRAPRPAGVSSS